MNLEWLWGIDWKAVFALNTPLLEIVVRGSIVYLVIYTLLRVVLRRESSGVEMTDVLVIVLIADAAQNGMAGNYLSVTDGVVLVAVIIGWSALLAWLGYRFPAVRRLLHSPPLPLVRDGKLMRRNMRRELVTEDEILEQLRQNGVDHLRDVHEVLMESDGSISVVRRFGRETHPRTRRRQP